MTISPSTLHAFERVAQRQAELRSAFVPGATGSSGTATHAAPLSFSVNPLAVAAPADTYFVGSDDRAGRTYSQDGDFALQDATIVDRTGRPVLGIGKNGALEPVRVDAVDAALGRAKDLHVEGDGSVVYTRSSIEPRTGVQHHERVVCGRIALARFPAATVLRPLDATHGLAPEGIVPHTGVPSEGGFEPLHVHALRGSAVDFDRGIARLEEAYLAFDALRAAHHAQGGVEKIAMDLVK